MSLFDIINITLFYKINKDLSGIPEHPKAKTFDFQNNFITIVFSMVENPEIRIFLQS